MFERGDDAGALRERASINRAHSDSECNGSANRRSCVNRHTRRHCDPNLSSNRLA